MVYRRKDDTISRRIAGETLLVPIRGRLADLQRLFALEGAAEFIWERLDGKQSLTAICDQLIERYDVTREQAESDANEFVQRLKEEDLVAEVD